MRKTKIIATLSAKLSYEQIKEMADFFDCARINLSHGSYEDYEKITNFIRQIEREKNKYIPILFDISGPKIRVTNIEIPLEVKKKSKVALIKKTSDKTNLFLAINFPEIINHLKIGDRVYIDDGKIRFKVTEIDKDGVILEALTDGIIRKNKGLNFPDTELPLPSLTEKDLKDLDFVSKLNPDFIALSFVRKKEDIFMLRKELDQRKVSTSVIAKIERPEVIKVLEDVIEVSDGIMVARGDLGIELSLEKVPIIQKKIVELCKNKGKFSIVATQILETMVEKPEPTRAEVSDIANAIFDGFDALMLSGETASGSFPLESLQILDRVAKETEKNIKLNKSFDLKEYNFLKDDITSTIAFSAYISAITLKAKAIISFTASGQTAGILSKFRYDKDVIAVSYDIKTLRKCSLFYGIKPLLIKKSEITDELMFEMEKLLLDIGFKDDELIIMTIGLPVVEKGHTNMMKVHKIGGYLPYKEKFQKVD
ncbi:MAG: pyruvate kinase [Proteobacteria bacterium]|nr:pyruvate kinase [Pseudomonadota bacterium]